MITNISTSFARLYHCSLNNNDGGWKMDVDF